MSEYTIGCTAEQPRVHLSFDGEQPRSVLVSEIDAARAAELHSQCQQVSGNVIIDISSISLWPDQPRAIVLNLVKSVGSRFLVRVGQQQFTDPFRAVLAAMANTDNLQAHGNSLRAAKEAAALFCDTALSAAAKLINARAKEIGGSAENHASLTKELQQLAGAGGSGQQQDADLESLARGFVSRLRSEAGIEDSNAPVLLYFRSEFHVYNDHVWRVTPDDSFRAQVTEFLQSIGIENVNRTLTKDIIANLEALSLFSDWEREAPLHIISFKPAVSEKRPVIVCNNGLLNLDDAVADSVFAISNFDSHFFSRVKLPFDFDPDAACRQWEAFLTYVLPSTTQHDRRIRVLQEHFGDSLIGDRRHEMALFIFGPAATGKSTVLRVWEAMLGHANVSHLPLDQISGEFRLVELCGKLANFSAEIDHMGKGREGILKQLISGEPINVNRKFKSPVELRSSTKLVFAGNDLPDIVDTSDGVWRRLTVIPFDRVVPRDQRDVLLIDRLLTELPGILNWAIRGRTRLLEQEGFSNCRKCRSVLDMHRTMSDSVREFYQECLQRNSAWDSHGQRFFEIYTCFCRHRGRKPVGESEFGKRMKRLGILKRRARSNEEPSRPWLYRGIVLNGIGREWAQRCSAESNTTWVPDDISYDALNGDSGPDDSSGPSGPNDPTGPSDPSGPSPVQVADSDLDHANPVVIHS
jgi:P4 family phage/plasmid primase-like protien